MVNFSEEQVNQLERILLRERAEALAEKNDASKLYAAYGEKRETFNIRTEEAYNRYKIANELLDTLRE